MDKSKKRLFYIKVIFLLAVLLLLILSAYILINNNFNELLNKSSWEIIGNLANILGLIGIAISVFIYQPLSLFKKIQNKIDKENFPTKGTLIIEKSYDALIFTVSRSDIPNWMIANYKPKAIGLVGSIELSKSVDTIKEEAEEQGIKVHRRILENPDRVARVNEETVEIINTLQKDGLEKIAVDITGGKKPMSIGVFLAAEEHGLDSLYVSADYDKGVPIANSIKVILLSGNNREDHFV